MLSASEIQDLEKKVFNYRLKKNVKTMIYLIFALTCISIPLSYFIFPKSFQSLFTNESKHDTTVSFNIDMNVSQVTPHSVIAVNAKENNTSETKESYVEEPKEDTLMLRSPMVITENNKNTQKNETKKETQVPKEEKQMMMKAPPSFEETTFFRNAEEKIDTSVLAPPLLEDIKPKGIIKIETQEVNSIKYLKDKFEKTNNIIFALMLAEEYYLTKDYIQSNKWALIANHIDADNEKSWLWFAKSKVKLGQQEDAIVALKAYLKNSKSKAAQTLLNQIHLGELND